VVKPVVLAGLTAIAGFGSLGWRITDLERAGDCCAIGLFWSLAATIFFTLPAAVAVKQNCHRKILPKRNWNMRKIITVICLERCSLSRESRAAIAH